MGKSKTKMFEFLTLFVMVIGTVIGSGIYMKNSELLQQTGNPIIAIILWSFVGLTCIMSMMVFIEISSSTKHFGNGTLGNWAKILIGRKTASFFSIMYSWVYIPGVQSLYVAGAINYLLLAMNVPITPAFQLMIYLIGGISLMFMFTIMSIYKRYINSKLQIASILIKFVPLLMAFVAGFFLMDKNSAMWNGGNGNDTWGTDKWSPILFFGGFGGILLAFDGYVYIAKYQKIATHKDIVPKALFAGMLFVAVFYVLMAISLFLGSPDGSVVELLMKLFNINNSSGNFSRIFSNLILMMVCLLGSSIFVDIEILDLASDANNKIIYTKNRGMTLQRAGFIQFFIFTLMYTFLLFIGIFTIRAGWDGINTSITSENLLSKPIDYINWYASGTSALVFMIILSVMIAGVVNRFTKKVKLEQTKFFLFYGITSSIFMSIFVVFGILSFIWKPTEIAKGNWKIDPDGIWFLIIFIVALIVNTIVFFIQEYKFRKDPYIDGWDGEISSELNVPDRQNIRADLKLLFKTKK